MTNNILFLKLNDIGYEEIISELREQDYHIVEYDMSDETDCDTEKKMQEIDEIIYKNFFYFVLTGEFHEELYKICLKSATKYVTCIGQKRPELINYYTLFSGVCIFDEKEKNIYNIINELFELHTEQIEPVKGLKDLKDIEDENEVIRLTDLYFESMESEQQLCFQMRERLMEYIDSLLQKRTEDSWREIVLWNKRHECRKLSNRFWQFYLLQKASSIFAEEMIQYYESGEAPSIVQFGSFGELSETYFHLLLLLRRLNYGVAPEEKCDIIDYIMEKKVSGIFIRHVIEQNQIEDKEKVYKRLEELLIKYEQ